MPAYLASLFPGDPHGDMPSVADYARNPDAFASRMIPDIPGATGTAHEAGLRANFTRDIQALRLELKFKVAELVAQGSRYTHPRWQDWYGLGDPVTDDEITAARIKNAPAPALEGIPEGSQQTPIVGPPPIVYSDFSA